MALLKVITHPNPILKKPTEKVGDITSNIKQLVGDMIQTMQDSDGVGLAANQVGVSKSVLICAPNAEQGPIFTYINPEIIDEKGEVIGPEGCLSLPGMAANINRAQSIRLRYMTLKGQTVEENYGDFHARIIQHEIDHLHGKLLIDRVGFKERVQLLEHYKGKAQVI